ncbi:MAG TPA: hypothetical protein VK666_28620 [Chryseolinea sp.]|nr:hypothetical protein [Chryseolinea sp.]
MKKKGLSIHDGFSLDHFLPQNVGEKKTLLACLTCYPGAGDDFYFSMMQAVKDTTFEPRITGGVLEENPVPTVFPLQIQ